MQKVGTEHAARSEVAQGPWHQKVSFSASLGEVGREEASAYGPSGKCHFAFQGGSTKMKVFVKHCCGWHFVLLLSILRSGS